MTDVTIKASLSCPSSIQGKLSYPSAIQGKLSIDGYPVYDGAYDITPSSEPQVLPTAQKSVKQDIVINPIPSNYGLITWNGSFITVS